MAFFDTCFQYKELFFEDTFSLSARSKSWACGIHSSNSAICYWSFKQGLARTQIPTNKNDVSEFPTFEEIAGVSHPEVQWNSLALEELPWWSQLTSRPGKYACWRFNHHSPRAINLQSIWTDSLPIGLFVKTIKSDCLFTLFHLQVRKVGLKTPCSPPYFMHWNNVSCSQSSIVWPALPSRIAKRN